jgi:hypothetical protein
VCAVSFPSLIEASRAAWCGAPLEMTEGTVWIWGTEGLSIRPRCSNPNDGSNYQREVASGVKMFADGLSEALVAVRATEPSSSRLVRGLV